MSRPLRATRTPTEPAGLLALAASYEGGSRLDADRSGSVTLQIVHDWSSGSRTTVRRD